MAQEPGHVSEAIAEQREELGETVEALAERADVKARVQHKATDAAEKVRHRGEAVAHRVREATPDPVASTVEAAATSVRRRSWPYAVAAAAVLGLLVARRLRKK